VPRRTDRAAPQLRRQLALILCTGSGELATFDVATRTELRRSKPPACADGSPAQPVDIELEPPGAQLLVVSTNANRVDELELATGKWVRSMPTAPHPTAVGWCRAQPGTRLTGELPPR